MLPNFQPQTAVDPSQEKMHNPLRRLEAFWAFILNDVKVQDLAHSFQRFLDDYINALKH